MLSRTSSPSGAPPGGLVGRDAERAAIDAALDALPHSSVLLVEGEPGIGKSALLGWAADEGRRRGAQVFQVECEEHRSLAPGSALDQLLTEPGRLAGEGVAGEALSGFRSDQPAVLVVDDFQWADPTHAGLLVRVAESLVDHGAVVLFAKRLGEASPQVASALDRLARLRPRRLRVGPLDAAGIEAMLARQLDATPGKQLLALAGTTGGNPFYTLTLLDGIRAEGALERVGESVEFAGTGVPETTRWSVLERVAAAGPGVLATMRVAAVLGRRFDLQLLSVVSGLSRAEVVDAVTRAADIGMLQSEGDAVAFRHDILRESLYADQLPAVRGEIHRQAFDALVQLGRSPSDQLVHLAQMPLTEDDIPTVLAMAGLADAFTYLDLVDAALDAARSPEHQLQLRAVRVDALQAVGRYEDCIAAADALLAHPLPPFAAVLVKASRLRARFTFGHTRTAFEEYQLTEGADPVSSSVEMAQLAWAAAAGRQPDRVGELFEGVLRLGDAAHPGARAIAHFARAWSALDRNRFDDAHRALDDGLEALADDPTPIGRVAGPDLLRSLVHAAAGEFEAVAPAARLDAERSSDASGAGRAPYRHGILAVVAVERGRFADAAAELEAGFATFDDVRGDLIQEWLWSLGQMVDALTAGRPSGSWGEAPDVQVHVLSHWSAFARSFGHEVTDRGDLALGALLPAVEPGGPIADPAGLTLCGPRAVRLGLEHDPTLVATVGELVTTTLAELTDPLSRLAVDWVEALLAGDHARLIDAADRVARDLPFRSVLLREDAARLAIRTGATGAKDAVRGALEAARSIGALGLAASLRRHARTAGVNVRLRADAAATDNRLTASERLVVDHVADGLTNAQIGEQLGISRRTVESHLHHTYNKLGLTSRLELYEWARAQRAVGSA